MKSPATNVELITQLMNVSQYGALAQAFVIDALTKHAEAVAALTDDEVAELDKNSAVHMPAWRGVAREIKQKMDEFYRR
ncbi:hypothetical protein [Burkholderia cenocepacia]|uniref:hypothetical protein n=1 Tax=Burkholderia cenocepacia TaxID=95486 RepID=UPI00264ED56C|nr:hypothetical protein [Burkholderia cenocepacia]MDN7537064.1 hypothetical protein [Burkholderia cenocepacia]